MTTPVTPQATRFGINLNPLRYQLPGDVVLKASKNIFNEKTWEYLRNDTWGVLLPKMVVSRTSLQRFEDVLLELLEDVPFYFMVPFTARVLFAKPFKALAGLANTVPHTTLGVATRLFSQKPSNAILGAKAGVLGASLTLALGVEFLVQHIKNIVTARQFNIKNFTAVAGLEKKRNKVHNGEVDPVEKAYHRIKQVSALMVAGVLACALLPLIIRKSDKAANLAYKVMKELDFAVDKKTLFDMSKPILAVISIVGGLTGYLDASRGDLEFKENATRLGFVIPYLVFGSDVANNLMGKWFERAKVPYHGQQVRIKDQFFSFLRKRTQHDYALELGRVIDETTMTNKLLQLRQSQALPTETFIGIAKNYKRIKTGSVLIKSVGMGGLFSLWLFYVTKKRFLRQQKQEQAPLNSNPLTTHTINNYPNVLRVAANFSSPAWPPSVAYYPYHPAYSSPWANLQNPIHAGLRSNNSKPA